MSQLSNKNLIIFCQFAASNFHIFFQLQTPFGCSEKSWLDWEWNGWAVQPFSSPCAAVGFAARKGHLGISAGSMLPPAYPAKTVKPSMYYSFSHPPSPASSFQSSRTELTGSVLEQDTSTLFSRYLSHLPEALADLTEKNASGIQVPI